MSKTTVATITAKIKRLSDYNITDSDLDTLILDTLDLATSLMAQWFADEGLLDEITAHDTINTTALQEYVDIAASTVDLDQPVILTERTNDQVIPIIPFAEYREMFPDPAASSQETADVAAFFANRLYLGPTPASVITYYLDYTRLITELTANDSLPFEHKYDPLVIAISMQYLAEWLEKSDSMIARAMKRVETLKHELIVGASRNSGIQQVKPRYDMPYFAPRKPLS